MAFAVSRSQAKSGRRAGRQAARMPTFNSMLCYVSGILKLGHSNEILLVPYLKCVSTGCVSTRFRDFEKAAKLTKMDHGL